MFHRHYPAGSSQWNEGITWGSNLMHAGPSLTNGLDSRSESAGEWQVSSVPLAARVNRHFLRTTLLDTSVPSEFLVTTRYSYMV